MENKEYQFGQYKKKRHGPHGGPPGMGLGEKAKDLLGTWKKLIGYCKTF